MNPADNLGVSYDHSQVQAQGFTEAVISVREDDSPRTGSFISSEAGVFWDSGHDERLQNPGFYLRGLMSFRGRGCASIYKFIKLCQWLPDFQVCLQSIKSIQKILTGMTMLDLSKLEIHDLKSNRTEF